MSTSTEQATAPKAERGQGAPVLEARGVNFWYGDAHALVDVDLEIHRAEVMAFMGPSGCGKTTLLKLFNRMHDEIRSARVEGQVLFEGEDIYGDDIDPPMMRRHFGWVAQAPNPFARSIYENVSYGPALHGLVEAGDEMDAHVRWCLERADLWEEVADRLEEPGTDLSGGQQQRLCIARALSTEPTVLLMDEPCSSIDPIATSHIEELIRAIGRELTVVLITHNLEQARRLADRVAFFKLGRVLEVGAAEQVFTAPRHPETRDYLAGKFG